MHWDNVTLCPSIWLETQERPRVYKLQGYQLRIVKRDRVDVTYHIDVTLFRINVFMLFDRVNSYSARAFFPSLPLQDTEAKCPIVPQCMACSTPALAKHCPGSCLWPQLPHYLVLRSVAIVIPVLSSSCFRFAFESTHTFTAAHCLYLRCCAFGCSAYFVGLLQ